MSFTRGTAITPVDYLDGLGVPDSSVSLAAYNQAAEQLLSAEVKWEGGSNAFCKVDDTANGTAWETKGKAHDAANDEDVQIFYVLSSAAHATNVIRARFYTDATYTTLKTVAYFGIKARRFNFDGSTPTVVDWPAPVGGGGPSTTPTTAAFDAGNLAICAVADYAGTTNTPGAGYDTTDEWDSSAIGGHSFSRIDAPGGPIVGDGTLATSASWSIVAIAFTDAGGGGSTGYVPPRRGINGPGRTPNVALQFWGRRRPIPEVALVGAGVDAALSEVPDTIAAAVTTPVAVSVGVVETADQVSSLAGAPVTASVGLSEVPDVVSITAVEAVAADISINEVADLVVAQSVTPASNVDAALLDQIELVTSGVTTPEVAAAAIRDIEDGLSVVAVEAVAADQQVTEQADNTVSAVASTANTDVSVIISEQSDALTSANQNPAAAAVVINEQSESIAAATAASVVLTLLFVEVNDAVSALLLATVAATESINEQTDPVESVSGSVASADLNVSYAEEPDRALLVATEVTAAAAIVVEQAESAPSAGTVPATAIAALIEQAEALSAMLELLVAASAVVVEGPDYTASSSGAVTTQASAQIVETDDRALSAAETPVTVSVTVLEEVDRLLSALAAEVVANAAIFEQADRVSAGSQLGVPGFVETAIQAITVVKQALSVTVRSRVP